MTKYSVGDVVTVVDLAQNEVMRDGTEVVPRFAKSMEQYLGKNVTIRNIVSIKAADQYGISAYNIDEDVGMHVWYDTDFVGLANIPADDDASKLLNDCLE